MSDTDKVVAAILANGILQRAATQVPPTQWVNTYKEVLAMLEAGQPESKDDDIKNAIVTAIDSVLGKKRDVSGSLAGKSGA